ncbi:hypothetical protein TNCV_1268731 [Trichonephila clavipes]|nr:hypothetical protein TNCV_1268731 [Trichonephila clavipes]
MQLLPWPAYSTDMSPIEPVGNLVGRHLARDPCPAASKDEIEIIPWPQRSPVAMRNNTSKGGDTSVKMITLNTPSVDTEIGLPIQVF